MPGLFRGLGTTIKEIIIIIAKEIIIKSFLFSLIKVFPLEEIKRKNIKIKEVPKPRYEPRVKVNIRLPPMTSIPISSNSFFILFLLTKKRGTAIVRGIIKYSAK